MWRDQDAVFGGIMLASRSAFGIVPPQSMENQSEKSHREENLRLFLVVIFCFSLPLSSQAKGRFEGNLELRDVASKYINAGEYDPGWTEFELLSDYTYVDAAGKSWTVPKGTVVNGASIPKAVWSIVGGPWSGRYRNAAVIHDYLCEKQVESSIFVHRLFHEALLASEVAASTARVMYAAVRRFGPQWDKAPRFAPRSIVRRRPFDQQEFEKILTEIENRKLGVDGVDRYIEGLGK